MTKRIKNLRPSEVWQWVVDNVGYYTPVKLGVDSNPEGQGSANEIWFKALKPGSSQAGLITSINVSSDDGSENPRQFWDGVAWTNGTYTGNFYVLEDSLPQEPEKDVHTMNIPQEIDFSKIKVGDKVWIETKVTCIDKEEMKNEHGYSIAFQFGERHVWFPKSTIKAHFPQESELEKAEKELEEIVKWSPATKSQLDEYYQARKKVEQLKNNQ